MLIFKFTVFNICVYDNIWYILSLFVFKTDINSICFFGQYKSQTFLPKHEYKY